VGLYWTSNPDATTSRPTPGMKPKGPTGDTAISSCKNVSEKYPLNPNHNVVGYFFGHIPEIQRPFDGTAEPKTMPYTDPPWASAHPGGVHFSLGDGSVRFFNDSVDMKTMMALASRNGDETVTLP